MNTLENDWTSLLSLGLGYIQSKTNVDGQPVDRTGQVITARMVLRGLFVMSDLHEADGEYPTIYYNDDIEDNKESVSIRGIDFGEDLPKFGQVREDDKRPHVNHDFQRSRKKDDENKAVRNGAEQCRKRKREEDFPGNELEVGSKVARINHPKPVRRSLLDEFNRADPPKTLVFNPDKPLVAPRFKPRQNITDDELCSNCKEWIVAKYPFPTDPQRANFTTTKCSHLQSVWRFEKQLTPPSFKCEYRYSFKELHDGRLFNH